jgi:osmotically-inducible protein OsmY
MDPVAMEAPGPWSLGIGRIRAQAGVEGVKSMTTRPGAPSDRRGVEQLRRQIAHAAQITFNVLPDQVTVTVHNGVVRLDGRVGLRSLARELEGQAAATDGVIAVESRLEWELDDVRTDERLRATEVKA